jgi:hypothetical protein
MAPLTVELAGVMMRAIVMGVFGGIGLILMHALARRAFIVYLMYAALLLSTALMLGQFDSLPFAVRFSAVLISVTVASFLFYVRVAIRSARAAQRRLLEGKPPIPVDRPWWGFPFVVGALAAVSGGVAVLIR